MTVSNVPIIYSPFEPLEFPKKAFLLTQSSLFTMAYHLVTEAISLPGVWLRNRQLWQLLLPSKVARLANCWNGTGIEFVFVCSDLSSGLLPAYCSYQRSDLAAVLYLWTFILANLATDFLLPGAFAIRSQLRLPTESSLPKFLNLCFAILASRSFWWTWRRLLLAIPEPKMNRKRITTFQFARQQRRNSHQSQLSEQLLRQGDIAKDSQNRSQGKQSPCKGSAVFCSLQLESNCNLNQHRESPPFSTFKVFNKFEKIKL